MAAAAESRRRDRRASPTGRWGVCENGGLSLGTWVLPLQKRGRRSRGSHDVLVAVKFLNILVLKININRQNK